MKNVLASAAVLAMVSGASHAATIYQNNFDTGLGTVTTTGTIRSDNGVTYLGNLTAFASASFTVNTAGYTNLKLALTLYAVLSLDGLGPQGGNSPANPDNFLIGDNAGTVFNESFANFNGGNTQSYGGPGLSGVYAPRTGEAACNALGFGCGDFGDATYLLTGLSLTPAGNGSLTVTLTGRSNQGVGDEFFGIDDIVVTGDLVPAGIPEPASLAVLATCLGLAGTLARRRTG